MSDDDTDQLRRQVKELQAELGDLALRHAELSSVVASLANAALWPGHRRPGDLQDILERANRIADQGLEAAMRVRDQGWFK